MNQADRKNRNIFPVQKCINGADIATLSDQELLAIILSTGTREQDVLDLSLETVKKFGSLGDISLAGIRELADIKGIGMKKAIRIHAAFEMGRRVITRPMQFQSISSPEDVWKLLLPFMAGLQKEEFRLLTLNNKNYLLKHSVISIGTVSETIVHPRDVFREAIRENGASVIVAHNHPTGILRPSRDDIETTMRLHEVGNLVGIPLLDHVIITNVSFLSMKEEGYIG